MVEYTPEIFEQWREPSRRAAAAMVPELRRLVSPRSVVDVGCGTGSWLAAFEPADVLGWTASCRPRRSRCVPYYYSLNTVLYARPEQLEKLDLEETPALRLVHPTLYEYMTRGDSRSPKLFEKLTRRLRRYRSRATRS